MRNTTKLKQVLLKYDIDLSMDDDELMRMTLVDKTTGALKTFENSSYSWLINKAFSFFKKELKESIKN